MKNVLIAPSMILEDDKAVAAASDTRATTAVSSEFNEDNVERDVLGRAVAVRCIEKRAEGGSASAGKQFAKLWLRVWDEANGKAENASRRLLGLRLMETIKL